MAVVQSEDQIINNNTLGDTDTAGRMTTGFAQKEMGVDSSFSGTNRHQQNLSSRD